MTKEELLARIEAARSRLEDQLARFDDAQMLQPGVEDDWSVKDLVAHIAGWTDRLVHLLEAALRDELPDPWDDVDRANARIYAESKDLPLPDVMNNFHTSYQRMLRAIDVLTDADLNDPHRFEWTGGSELRDTIAGDTYEHYAEHDAALEAWIDKVTAKS